MEYEAVFLLVKSMVIVSSCLLRATATVRRSTTPVSTAAIGVLRLTRAVATTRATSTSTVAMLTGIGAIAATGAASALSQNKAKRVGFI